MHPESSRSFRDRRLWAERSSAPLYSKNISEDFFLAPSAHSEAAGQKASRESASNSEFIFPKDKREAALLSSRLKSFLTCGALIISLGLLLSPVALGAERGPVVSLREIRERGVVMQKWETSCAAAAVATVLTYGFRDAVSEGYVAVRMLEYTEPSKVRAQGGFSLLDMKRFAEDRGYTAQAYKHLSLEDLRLFHAPIVPISTHGYNHYVVFNGIKGDRVLLADPAFGNRRMTIDRFLDAWLDGLVFVIDRPAQEAP